MIFTVNVAPKRLRSRTMAAISLSALCLALGSTAYAAPQDYVGYPVSTNVGDWVVDRADAASFENVGGFQGRENVLKLGIAPPAEPITYYNWQGYYQKTVVPAGDSFIGGDLWVQNGWQTGSSTDFVNTGMWGATMPAAVVAQGSYVDAAAVFPIVHFSNESGVGRLKVWDTTANSSTGWITLDGTNGTIESSGLINYASWNSLDMRLITTDGPTRIEYWFNDTLVYTWNAPDARDGSIPEQFFAMFLKARNNGVTSFDTYWSRLLQGQLITANEPVDVGDTDSDVVIVAPTSGPAAPVTIIPNATIDGNVVVDGGTTSAVVTFGTGSTITQDVVATNADLIFAPNVIIQGSTALEGGTTTTGGTVSQPIIVQQNLTTDPTTTLGGNWQIGGNASLGGVVTPGNSIGVVNVGGSVNFGSSSVYAVEVDATGAADRINVGGTAFLDGWVTVTPYAGYLLNTPYTILTAGALSGTFDGASFSEATAFVDANLSYDSSTVYVTIGRNSVSYASAATTPNQFATAMALDTLPLTNPLGYAIAFSTAEQAAAAFDQLSGEAYASTSSLFIEQSSLVRNALIDRLRSAQGGVGASAAPVVSYVGEETTALSYAAPAKVASGPDMPLKAVAAPANTERLALWATGFGNWGDLDGNGNAASLSSDTGGFLIGADTLVGAGWRLGVAGGYSYTNFDVTDRNSSGDSDNWHLGLFAGNQWGALALRTGLAYTWQDVSTNRSVAIPGYSDSLSADYDAGTFQAFGELGYRIATAYAAFEPFANLAYVNLNTDGYTEEGGAAALTGDVSDMDTTFTTLGIRVAKEIVLGKADATLRGAIGWRHAFGDITPSTTQYFAGSDAFTVTGTPIAENAAVIEAGLDVLVGTSSTLGVAYTGQFGDDVTQNGFNATFKVSF